ncbi:MAG: recombinase family protein [Oscillospiraceae bacterium]
MSEEYAIYLRKSRVDTEYGEAETLAKHEKALTELARQRNLNVTAIYKEIVSGDTIAARPVMQQLLSEVEKGMWSGVLVMEVERLARGDTIDQGIVAQTFKYSGTTIITPAKTYNPENQFDEEYFEFGLFMSRREYKTINRRLQQGRIASVKQGNFIGSIAPYGYNKIKKGHNYTLEINPDEAEIVKTIFNLYVNGENGTRIGIPNIANYLNRMNISTRNGGKWNNGTVRGIIENPVYIGKIRWNARKTVKNMSGGVLMTSRPRNLNVNEVMLIDGIHNPIISEETYNAAQDIRKAHRISPIKVSEGIVNPLTGLVICSKCGHKMVRRPCKTTPDYLICQYSHCDNVSSVLSSVEKRIIESLRTWLNSYQVEINNINRKHEENNSDKIRMKKSIEKEIADTDKQLSKVYDLFEKEIYDTDTFLRRSEKLKKRSEELNKEYSAIKSEIAMNIENANAEIMIIPKVEKILETYYTTESPADKNYMLRQVLEKVEYTKDKGGRWGNPDDYEIKLFFRLPKK